MVSAVCIILMAIIKANSWRSLQHYHIKHFILLSISCLFAAVNSIFFGNMKYWSPPDTNFRPIRHSAVCDIPNEYSRIPNAQHHVPKAYQKVPKTIVSKI